MSELLVVPLKKPSDVDVAQPLKNTINLIYSTSKKVVDYTEQVNEFSKLRKSALWKSFENGNLEDLYSYYDQLVAIEKKMPFGELQIPFKWKDAFIKGSGFFSGRTSLTISLISYERVCVLFNIAALQSSVASNERMDSDDGLKNAAKLLQESAGMFAHLRGTVMGALQQEPTADLHLDTLAALSSLMLAQAQEMFVCKAIRDNMKEAIIAKLANQTNELYAEALKLMQKDFVRTLWDKEWLPIVAGKQVLYLGMAEYYQAMVCKTNKAVGEQITRLQNALELLKTAQLRSGKPTLAADIISKAQRHLAEAIKDNDFIYHEKIPDVKSLPPVGLAVLAKALPVAPKLSQNFKDLFEDLVPVAVHQAMMSYENRKNELVTTEVTKLREATQLLNSVLASLNLPAALEDSSGEKLPQSLVAKSSAVRQLGGIDTITDALNELPGLLTRNREILDETQRILNDEQESDDQLRQQFGDKWKRLPSAKLTELFRSNIAKYHLVLNNAIDADRIVRDRYDMHKRSIELLSEGPEVMAASVPHSGGSSIDNSTSSCNKLRALMEEVETIKAERDTIECELKSATTDMKDTFKAAIQDIPANEPSASAEILGRAFGPLQQQVKESLEKQDNILANIQRTNSEFVSERSGQSHSAERREATFKELASAHDAYMDLIHKLQEGKKFYNDFTQVLLATQSKVSDFCFARKTEKEELLKDFTKGFSSLVNTNVPQHPSTLSGVTSAVLSGVLQTGLNTISSYLQGGGGKTDPKKPEAKTDDDGKIKAEGRKEPPPRPPPPTVLPYPVQQPQHMPQPYAPALQAPYLQHAVPMTGYYTLPFPHGAYPDYNQYPRYPVPQYLGYPLQPPPDQQQQQPPHNPQW